VIVGHRGGDIDDVAQNPARDSRTELTGHNTDERLLHHGHSRIRVSEKKGISAPVMEPEHLDVLVTGALPDSLHLRG
jgi:hypothetical protein